MFDRNRCAVCGRGTWWLRLREALWANLRHRRPYPGTYRIGGRK